MSHHDDDHYEPVHGLPELPPEGEQILWQGAPHWSAIALHVFHLRAVAIYFGLLVVWKIVAGLSDGLGAAAALQSSLVVLIPTVAGLGLFGFLAYSVAKTTVYTITNRRVAIRAGVAISKTVNVPFKIIESAAARKRPDGTMDIPLKLTDGQKPAYLLLWPHVRPRQYSVVQPMLRGLINGEYVVQLLSQALCAFHGLDPAEAGAPAPGPQSAPAGRRGAVDGAPGAIAAAS